LQFAAVKDEFETAVGEREKRYRPRGGASPTLCPTTRSGSTPHDRHKRTKANWIAKIAG